MSASCDEYKCHLLSKIKKKIISYIVPDHYFSLYTEVLGTLLSERVAVVLHNKHFFFFFKTD